MKDVKDNRLTFKQLRVSQIISILILFTSLILVYTRGTEDPTARFLGILGILSFIFVSRMVLKRIIQAGRG